MKTNPVVETLGRKLKLAMIGGGPGSFIGGVHRMAARIDDRYQLINGVFSSAPEKSRRAAEAMRLDPLRTRATPIEMLTTEAEREDGADVVAIVTPNDTHFEYAQAALKLGFHVICDKPMTNTLAEAKELHALVLRTGKTFCLTHNYTGYPLVRQAKAMIAAGELGELLLVQVEYVQGGRAPGNDPPAGSPLPWRYDPSRGGPSLVMGDIGTHAHNLIRFITGREVAEVCAEAGSVVPERGFQDYAGALLRFDGGMRGSFWVTQAAAGVENCLSIRISGSGGTLEWTQELPQRLIYKPFKKPMQIRTPNGPGTFPESARASRIVAGHPEGFPEGFANIYSDAAEAIAASLAGTDCDPLALDFPDSWDGLKGVEFIAAVLESSAGNGKWVGVL